MIFENFRSQLANTYLRKASNLCKKARLNTYNFPHPSTLIVSILSIILTSTTQAVAERLSSTDHPNIIYILADDLGYGDLSCFGQKNFNTPNIDKLAREGMVFTQHYSGSTVCAPSRSTLLTGMHTGHTPIRGNIVVKPEGQHPIPANVATLPKLLKKLGYVTGAFGKWGLGFPGSEGDPNEHFDEFYGYNCQALAHNYYPYYLWDNTSQVALPKNKGQQKGSYAPDLIQQKTLEFIEKHRDSPFFCYVPTVIPHAELEAPTKYLNQFRGKLGKEIPFKGVDQGPNFRKGPYTSQAEPHATFAAMITLLDIHVGEIIQKLEKLGIREKTLVIFTSDNGPHKEGGADPDFFNSNGAFKGYKRDLYEGGIRIPMIASWPEHIPANSRSAHISAFWDFLPTVLDAINAHALAPENLDGISFLPTLLGQPEEQQQHEYLYWEFYENGASSAIRMGNWKAIRQGCFDDASSSEIELYDLSSDPGEINDLSSTYPEVLNSMMTIFKEAHIDSELFQCTPQEQINEH